MSRHVPVLDPVERVYSVGISGGSESGKPTLILALCRLFRDNYSLAVVTRQPSSDQDGCREFLTRHKALASARIVTVDVGTPIESATEWLTKEFRPELVFIEDGGFDSEADTPDFTIHVVNGSGESALLDDAIGASRSDLLVLNKTHVGPPLDVQSHVCVRESLRLRGDAPYVFAQLRYGIGTIEIAKRFLEHWRQTTAPAAWSLSAEDSVALTGA